MIWEWLTPVVLLLVFGGQIIHDAVTDRTPRRPWSWRRQGLDWWAIRRTERERTQGRLSL